MGYNPFRWYTQGKYRKKPLRKSAPLLLRIQNGDLEASPFFREAKDNEELYDKMYNEFMEKSFIRDEHSKQVEAHQYAKMKRIKAHKLMEKGLEEEQSRLRELKDELKKEFGKCLWDKSLKIQRGKGTTEDLYWWYKKQFKIDKTPSEMAIFFGKKSAKRFQPNI